MGERVAAWETDADWYDIGTFGEYSLFPWIALERKVIVAGYDVF